MELPTIDDVTKITGETLCPVCSASRDWVVANMNATFHSPELGHGVLVGFVCEKCGFARQHFCRE